MEIREKDMVKTTGEEAARVYEPLKVELPKRDNDKTSSYLITDKIHYGAFAILLTKLENETVEEAEKRDMKFVKKPSKDFNLLFGEVEVLEGNYYTNKAGKKHFDLRESEKKHYLVRIPLKELKHAKLSKKVADTVLATSINYKADGDNIVGYRFIIIPKDYKFSNKK